MGEAVVHRYREFEIQCLEGVEDQLQYKVDWAGGFSKPEDAHDWLDQNRLPEGESPHVQPGFLGKNAKNIRNV